MLRLKTRHLFPIIDDMLIELLQSLTPEQWQLPTLAKLWTVKDVAAHLLDGNIRTISATQNHQEKNDENISGYDELVAFLNELNATRVNAMRRVSPQLLISWLRETGRQYSRIMASQPMFEKARFSVAWAGEDESLNWFHVAREYTEKMHHQLQIRHAVNLEEQLLTKEFFYPFIDTLMYGLPHALRNTAAENSTTIRVTIKSDAGGDWFVQKESDAWKLVKQITAQPAASVIIPATIAWKLFTKGVRPTEVLNEITMAGNEQFCLAVLNMIAVMA